MVYLRGEGLTTHETMISNQEMAVVSATTDVLRTKGISAMAEFMASHAETIASVHATLLQDKTNFSTFGSERRSDMLLEYATGLTYFSKLSDEEKQGIAQGSISKTNKLWSLGC